MGLGGSFPGVWGFWGSWYGYPPGALGPGGLPLPEVPGVWDFALFPVPRGFLRPLQLPSVRFPCGGATVVFNHVVLAARVPGGRCESVLPAGFPHSVGNPVLFSPVRAK
jgi:hypothetical protein